MKRFLLSLFALLLIGGITKAEESYTISNIDLPQNGIGELQVAYSLDAKDCKAPSSEITEFANAHNIYLPAVVFEDGETYHAEDFIYATYTADKLKSLLDEHSKTK